LNDKFNPEDIARRADEMAYEHLAKEFACRISGRLVVGTAAGDRLMAIRHALKAQRYTERKKPALVLDEALELHFWSKNVHDNISMPTAIDKVLVFVLAEKTIVTRMGPDEYRFQFGLKQLFVIYTAEGWKLKSHTNFFEASGKAARGRALGHGPDRSL